MIEIIALTFFITIYTVGCATKSCLSGKQGGRKWLKSVNIQLSAEAKSKCSIRCNRCTQSTLSGLFNKALDLSGSSERLKFWKDSSVSSQSCSQSKNYGRPPRVATQCQCHPNASSQPGNIPPSSSFSSLTTAFFLFCFVLFYHHDGPGTFLITVNNKVIVRLWQGCWWIFHNSVCTSKLSFTWLYTLDLYS